MDKIKSIVQEEFTDAQKLRQHATENLECGAVTQDYQGDVLSSVRLLNEALATEIVCYLRYKQHAFSAQGLDSLSVAEEFMEHAKEEEEHADRLAKRIHQLGGNPDFNPETLLSRSRAQYREGETLVDMIREDLIAERVAIESYRELATYFGTKDPTTRRLIEDILSKEEEHAEELLSFLAPGLAERPAEKTA